MQTPLVLQISQLYWGQKQCNTHWYRCMYIWRTYKPAHAVSLVPHTRWTRGYCDVCISFTMPLVMQRKFGLCVWRCAWLGTGTWKSKSPTHFTCPWFVLLSLETSIGSWLGELNREDDVGSVPAPSLEPMSPHLPFFNMQYEVELRKWLDVMWTSWLITSLLY
jgi:hypothetical protein